jgi:uncharacterized protein (DUF2461 family)
MHAAAGSKDAEKQPRKAWVAPRAVTEKVRDITAGSFYVPFDHDGSCSS